MPSGRKALQSKHGSDSVMAPMDSVIEGPEPKRLECLTSIKEHQAAFEVFVGVQQIVSNIAHDRFLSQKRIGIKAFAVVHARERSKVAANSIKFCFRNLRKLIAVVRDNFGKAQGSRVQPCQPLRDERFILLAERCSFNPSAELAREIGELGGRLLG